MNTASLLQFLFSALTVRAIDALVVAVTAIGGAMERLVVRPVLEVGRVALSGASADLLADDQLEAAYLGG